MLKSIVSSEVINHIIKNRKILLNEKEKMLNNKVFNPALDYRLFKERLKCKKLCHEHNNISPELIRERNKIIKQIIKKTGKVFFIEQPFICDYGYNIEIGENFAANHNLMILDSGKITIGKNVMIGPNCTIITNIHPLDVKRRSTGLQWAKPITIEDNVWICANVTILAGVTIGENSIIGAGSIVTKSIPANSMAYGSPCKTQKTL